MDKGLADGASSRSISIEAQDQARLAALRELAILDTAPEAEFDDLVSLAAAICDVPISLISFIDEDRQWFKASLGLTMVETPRSDAFCDHVIRQHGLFIVEDATRDDRFQSNALVTGPTQWRFYAGFPLVVEGGEAVGTLCVVDQSPRCLSVHQQEGLRTLSAQVAARLELRRKRRELEEAHNRLKNLHAEAVALDQLFQIFMDSGPFVSYMKDADGRMLYYNRLLAERLGVDRQHMLGKTDAELWPPELATAFREHDVSVLQTGKLTVNLEITGDGNGGYTTWQSYKFPCTSGTGQMLLGGVSIDVTEQLKREQVLIDTQKELHRANVRLRKLASVDSLTGLALRRLFDTRLRVLFRKARRDGVPLALLMIDVDNFKRHNDIHGHLHGDAVLRALASCLTAQVRPKDIVARYGGEEFAILCFNTDSQAAASVAERVLAAVRELRVNEHRVTASVGISVVTGTVPDTVALITQADQALLHSKRTGKDRTSFWFDGHVSGFPTG